MKIGGSITSFSINRPKTVTAVMLIVTLALALLAVLPSLWPQKFKALNPLKVDTDPICLLDKNMRGVPYLAHNLLLYI